MEKHEARGVGVRKAGGKYANKPSCGGAHSFGFPRGKDKEGRNGRVLRIEEEDLLTESVQIMAIGWAL